MTLCELVRRLKDDAAGADAARRAALERLERALFEDQQLLVLVLVRRVRRLPRVERRDVDLELVERRRRRAHHLAHGAPVVRFGVVGRPVVDRRLLHLLLRDQRRDRTGRCDRDEERGERSVSSWRTGYAKSRVLR